MVDLLFPKLHFRFPIVNSTRLTILDETDGKRIPTVQKRKQKPQAKQFRRPLILTYLVTTIIVISFRVF